MPAPYTKSFSFNVVAGQENYVELGFIHRGYIKGFVLTQVGGVLAGFNADLFNSERPMLDAGSVGSAGDTEILGADNYRIIPHADLIAANGHDRIELRPENIGYAFRNVDGTYSVPIRKLYLRVHPSGTGSKAFELTLTGIPVM